MPEKTLSRLLNPRSIAIVVMLTALTTACDWTTFGFDTAHTRGTADAGPSLGHPALVDHVWTGTVASGAPSTWWGTRGSC